jgi:methyl-accepting chemotaxis protein
MMIEKLLAINCVPNALTKDNLSAEYTDLDTLISSCDVISLHTPLLESTYHMINHETVTKMKDGVVLVNCARGELMDMDALIHGIESQKIGALALDVIEGEDDLYHKDKMKLKNKILIPIISILLIINIITGVVIYGQIKQGVVMQLIEAQMKSQISNLKNNIGARSNIEETFLNTLDEKNLDLAESIAEIIKENPSMLETSKLQLLAISLGVDEIHITNGQGVITNGTIEDFYGFDFNTTDQTKPFIELIKQDNGRLAQEPSERGTDKAFFQYIGVSRLDEPGIVQIGLLPTYIDEIREDIGLQPLIEVLKIGESGYAYIIDKDGITLYHQNSDNVGTDIHDVPALSPILEKDNGFFKYDYNGETVYASFEKMDDVKIVTTLPKKDFENKLNNILISMIIIFTISLLSIIAVIIFIASKVTKPINSLVGIANSLADGNLDVSIDIHTKDETGQLATAFKSMTNKINLVMRNINVSSEQVAIGSNQVADSSMSLSQGATEQASSIEELTATIDDVASQTRKNADNAEKAKEISTFAEDYAREGNKQMADMLIAMTEINDSSNNISKIIKVIDEIAFQTNILALNAAIEAARAGEHGKGFAVVAEEVRNLAARSANAAKETTTMIEGSIGKVQDGTKIANATANALNKIVEGISKSTELVSEIAIASTEQAQSVEQIKQGITEIANVVHTTSATAEETAAASEELSGQAEMLKLQVATFKLKDTVNDIILSNKIE